MSRYFKPDSAFGDEAECAVCCCMWTDPVEIEKCEHIFCRNCISGLSTCPQCCGPVTALNRPNNAILRMLMRVRGGCSTCAWLGTYREYAEHTKCLSGGATPTVAAVTAAEPDPAQCPVSETMQGYYMESSAPSVPGGGPPAGAAAASAKRVERPPSSAERARWRSGLSSTSADYGLIHEEFTSLLNHFCDFATVLASEGDQATTTDPPRLHWRDACRLLRFCNFPNHPEDVEDLFATARESPATGGITFHALCLWLSLNRRNPQQWYAMPSHAYQRMLQVAQVLDEPKSGLFTEEQSHLLAEEYFERDVSRGEWDAIRPLLIEKDATMRQAFGLGHSRTRSSAVSAQAVKLPFHDILLCFSMHLDHLRRQRKEYVEEQKRKQVVQRVKRMVQHYEPSSLAVIDTTLSNFKGEEESLLMTLVAMYGPEPA